MWRERVSTYGRPQMYGEELLGRPTVADGRSRVKIEMSKMLEMHFHPISGH